MIILLFVMSIVALLGVVLFCKKTRKSLVVLYVAGFILGFLVEYLGTQRNAWEYTETDMFMFFNIPFEIFFGYAAGLMMAGLVVMWLVKNVKGENTYDYIVDIFPIIGAILLVVYVFVDIGTILPLVFFATWGLAISKKKSIPLIVGLLGFVFDVMVEGGLTLFTNYYEWNLNVALSFMLFGMAFAGYLTSGKRGK